MHGRLGYWILLVLASWSSVCAQVTNFALASTPRVVAWPLSVAVADLNGDGKPDLVSASWGSTRGALTVLTNDGSGGFGLNAVLWSGGSGPQTVTVADVNGNGKPDLITANTFENNVTAWTNNGHGVFGTDVTLSVANGPDYVTAADVNGDGQPDLISVNGAVNTPESLLILTNNGSGTFIFNATVNASLGFTAGNGGAGVYALAAADINGDGKPDLIRANFNAFSLTVFTNNGNGIFSSNVTLNPWALQPRDVVVADVNGDGKPDLVSTCSSQLGGLPRPTGYVAVFTNNGAGSFGTNAAQIFGPPSVSLVAADMNGYGKPDLVTADVYDNLLWIWTNNGNGVFGSNATVSVAGAPTSIASADLNRDGKPDIICASHGPSALGYPGYLSVFTNDGSGGFGFDATLNAGAYPFVVVAADVNGDGRLDLITANLGTNNLSVLLNMPYVDIGAQTNGEMLVWPYPSSGYVLQENADLGTSNWVDVTNPVNFIGGRNQVTLPAPAANNFFRLMHP